MRFPNPSARGGSSSSPASTGRRVKRLRKQYREKLDILRAAFGDPVSDEDFNLTIFRNGDAPRVYVVEEQATWRVASTLADIAQIAIFRPDVYVPMADFFGNRNTMRTIKTLYAFVVDLDHMRPKCLPRLIDESRRAGILPTLVLNSGQGVHLVFVFPTPVECYKHVVPELKRIRMELYAYFEALRRRIRKTSWHVCQPVAGLIQPYRFCGSQTKLGDVATGFRAGPLYSLEDICRRLAVDPPRAQGCRLQGSSGPLPAWRTRENAEPGSSEVAFLPNASHGLYHHVLRRMFKESEPGHRYTALFALCVCAYKSRIPREKLDEDLRVIVEAFNKRNPENKVLPREIPKALRGYSQRFVKVTARTLENWLGFRFPKATKRNGKSRREHLEMIRERRRESSIGKIRAYLEKNRGASIAQTARDLRMSRNTVRGHFEVCLSAGADQFTAYNTPPLSGGRGLRPHWSLACRP